MDFVTDKQMFALMKAALEFNAQVTVLATQVLAAGKKGVKLKPLQQEIQRLSTDYNKRIEKIMSEGDN